MKAKENSILVRGRVFLILYLGFLLLSGSILILFSKGNIHLWINGHHSALGDWFFTNVTIIGDGIFSLAIALVLLFFELRRSIVLLLSWMVSGIIVQILKIYIFSNVPRPVTYFQGSAILHLVAGIKHYAWQSFPSGHSASVFALFLCLSIYMKNRLAQCIFFLVAVIVAYSRMYLSEHFLIDVTGGSLIGICIAWLFLYLIYLRNPYPVLSKSIISLMKK